MKQKLTIIVALALVLAVLCGCSPSAKKGKTLILYYSQTVAKRSYDGTEEYRFDVKSQMPDGRESSSTIYVIVPQGGTPEFTQVVR